MPGDGQRAHATAIRADSGAEAGRQAGEDADRDH